MPSETIHYPDGRRLDLVELSDTSERFPINRAVADVMKILEQSKEASLLVFTLLKMKHGITI